MRKTTFKTGAIVTAIALSVSGMAVAAPLAPGKPAGVHAAQFGSKEWLVFGGIAVVATAVLIANVGSGDHAASAVSSPATLTSP
jgi:hypothetical protein